MLSKLALIGAAAYQAQAAQLFSQEDSQIADMLNLFQEVQMEQESLLKISITKGNLGEMEGHAKELDTAYKNYQVDKKIAFKAKMHW